MTTPKYAEDFDAMVPASDTPDGKCWLLSLSCPCGGDGFDLVYRDGYVFVSCRGCKTRMTVLAIARRTQIQSRLAPGFFD